MTSPVWSARTSAVKLRALFLPACLPAYCRVCDEEERKKKSSLSSPYCGTNQTLSSSLALLFLPLPYGLALKLQRSQASLDASLHNHTRARGGRRTDKKHDWSSGRREKREILENMKKIQHQCLTTAIAHPFLRIDQDSLHVFSRTP